MIDTFHHRHAAMLLKYSGISFIAGAVNHGFFSGERSLWTAAVGVLLFVIGATLEYRHNHDSANSRAGLFHTLLLGALLSVGLGFFTGGLQHFPDSPDRSAWVVPLGFAISAAARALSTTGLWRASSTLYSLVAGVVVGLGSYGTWQWLERNPEYLGSHAHGAVTHTSASIEADADSSPGGLTALRADRVLDIRMSDAMRFSPDQIQVQAGETLLLNVINDGKVPHELVLGTDAQLEQHAQAMKHGAAHGAHQHATEAAIHLGPGERGSLVVRFDMATVLQMACLISGHYDAGMRGKVEVLALAASQPSFSEPARVPLNVGTHGTHGTHGIHGTDGTRGNHGIHGTDGTRGNHRH